MTRNRLALSMGVSVLFSSLLARGLELPPQVSEFLRTRHVMDDGYRSVPPTSAGHAFRRYISSNWQTVLNDIASIAPEPEEQLLIISALEEDLPPRTYLKMLNKLCDLQKRNAISVQMLENAINGPRRGLLSNNYQDREVIEVVHRFQSQLPKTSKIQPMLTSILSGKQRAVDLEGAADAGDPPLEKLSSP